MTVDISDADQAPNTTPQILARVYNLINQTELFTDTYREWARLQHNKKHGITLSPTLHRCTKSTDNNKTQPDTVYSVLANIYASTSSTIQELANANTEDRQKMEYLFVTNNQLHEDAKKLKGTIDSLQI